MKSCVHLKSMRDMCWWPLENGRMHVQCCFACLWRAAARHTRERNLKPDICMCLVSTRFALRRENHMKQDSKGEIQQDILLYCHGNHTLMKSRKTINHLKKKEIKKKSVLSPKGTEEYALQGRTWHFHHLVTLWNKGMAAVYSSCRVRTYCTC